MDEMGKKRVLFICYSLSGQTSGILVRLAAGMEEEGVEVTTERLKPVTPIRFPLGGFSATFAMMLITFFRNRVPIASLSEKSREKYDLIILAGPTWSYHPSGPILSLFNLEGQRLFKGQTVLPVISCRGYWRMHWFGIRHLLAKCKARVPNKIVFSHPTKEPWRTVGVFLKIAGKNPNRSRLLGKVYPKYGHSGDQHEEAFRFGRMIGNALTEDTPLDDLNFHTPLALP
ncbi:MAG: hypothetical protein H8E41_10220 [Desulfobulbaceae bacterium]|uniref:Flavodoxin-like domain-containing protein n=1 Tax=Candidatus Desulfobia pelagia TaxID=2841692 RepID=A0A8J6NF03_9BACT|nr:hypothetical protein [Candidatus Desulfobia pelagia]